MFENLSTSQQVIDEASVESRSKNRRPADIEIDCTHPQIEIRVSPRHRHSVTTEMTQSRTSTPTEMTQSRTSTTTETSQRRSSSHRESQDPGSSSRFQPDTHSSRFDKLHIKIQSVSINWDHRLD